MNEQKAMIIFKIASATGYILDKVDEFQDTGIVKQRFKNTSKKFFNELLKIEESISNTATKEALEQLVQSYELFDNVLELSTNIQPKKMKSFNREFEQLKEKYS